MKKNFLFAFYEPGDCIIYNQEGQAILWTNILGCLEQKEKPISQTIIFYFSEYEKQITNMRIEYMMKFTDIEIEFIKIDCEKYDMNMIIKLFYDKILNFRYDYEKNNYFFLPPMHVFIRTMLFYFSITKNFSLNYMIPYSPLDAKYKIGEKVKIHPVDFSIYRFIAHYTLILNENDHLFLLNGIVTKNKNFINIINELATAVIQTRGPVMLYGESGCGKTQIAQRFAMLMKEKNYILGPFVEVNCATLNTSLVASQLFGHVKGAFTGAISNTKGLLASADKGILFLDEIALLDRQCQGMLLKAIENGYYFPIGSDTPVYSKFFLICATNVNLVEACKKGNFMEELLARISTWEFTLPRLKDRPEDFASNLDHELASFSNNSFTHIMMHANARKKYLDFATSDEAEWKFNFRDFHASVQRLAAHSIDGHITEDIVEKEIKHLRLSWKRWENKGGDSLELCNRFLQYDVLNRLDTFELMQLEGVLKLCLRCKNMAEAGRLLFNKSRMERKSINDSHRLRSYLQKYGISWKELKA